MRGVAGIVELIMRTFGIVLSVCFLLGSLQAATQPTPNAGETAQRFRSAKIGRMPSGQDFYPESAKRENLAGAAGIYVCVDAAALITSIDVLVSSGHAILDTAAVNLAREGQYIAAMTDEGKAVPSCVSFLVDFCTSSPIGKLFGGEAQCGSAAYLRAREDRRLRMVKASNERMAADQIAAARAEQRRREEAEETDRKIKQEEEARRLEQERLAAEQSRIEREGDGSEDDLACKARKLKPSTDPYKKCRNSLAVARQAREERERLLAERFYRGTAERERQEQIAAERVRKKQEEDQRHREEAAAKDPYFYFKEQCRELGFKDKTEKFGTCVLELSKRGGDQHN